MRLIDADELMGTIVFEIETKSIIDRRNLFDIIDSAPTIKAEPVRRGRWIKTDKHDIYYQPGYKCSVCEILTTCHGSYCPNCGAQMEEQE